MVQSDDAANPCVQGQLQNRGAVHAEMTDGSKTLHPIVLTVRTRPGRPRALRVSHRETVLYGAFAWACGALNSPKRQPPTL